MLIELASSESEFRTVKFRRGLNILIAEKSEESTDTDSRNGAGKSSLIEVLHFMLGLGRLTDSVLKKDALSNYSFTLTLDCRDGDKFSVGRSLVSQKRSRVTLVPRLGGVDRSDSVPLVLTNKEWVERIGSDLFGLPEDHAGVSVRGLLSLYLRRDSQGGMKDPILAVPRQSITEATANLAYLLGLNWRLVSGYQGIAARERLRRELSRATKDPVFGIVVGSASELRGQVVAASKRVDELSHQLDGFTVVPEYENIQRQADELDVAIRGSRARDMADRRNLKDLEKALRVDVQPETAYVERVYRELGLVLPDSVTRTFDEVRAFHDSVTRNRQAYLEAEIASTRARLAERRHEREQMGSEHARLLEVLSSGGALESYTEISGRLSSERARLETLTSRLETAKKLEATRSEIKIERLTLKQAVDHDLDERSSQVDAIDVLFQSFASELYGVDREAFVEIEPLETSLRIRPHIGGEDSRGIGQMTIFCFDLTWAIIAHRGGRGPDFLVHDSHLFDGVDERQVARALKLAAQVCEDEGIQYVITINSDDLAKTRPFGFDATPHIIEPRLTDSRHDGGLFGVQFQ